MRDALLIALGEEVSVTVPVAPPQQLEAMTPLRLTGLSRRAINTLARCQVQTDGELLALSDSIRELILGKRPASEIRRAAHDEGMVSLRESALEKVQLGLTTLREINKVTFVE